MKPNERRERIANVISEIDVGYVEEALCENPAISLQQDRSRIRKRRTIPCAVCAGILLLAIGIGIFSNGRFFSKGDSVPGTNAPNLEQTWFVGSGFMGFQTSKINEDAGALYEAALLFISEGKFTDYRAGYTVDAGYVGTLLERTTVHFSRMRYLPSEEEVESCDLAAEIYTIRNVSSEAAICLRLLESCPSYSTDHYYVFNPPNWQTNTLQEYVSSLDLETHLSRDIARATLFIRSESGEELQNRLSLDSEEKNEICERLLSLQGDRLPISSIDAAETYIQKSQMQGQLYLRAPTVGKSLFLMQIFDNGFLLLVQDQNWMLFEIGVQSAEELLQLLQRGIEDDITNGSESTTSQTADPMVETSGAYFPKERSN